VERTAAFTEPLPAGELAAPESVAVTLHAQLNQMRVDVAAPKAALVVLNELAVPGWRLEIDGKSAPLYTANGAFRTLWVPPGSHLCVLAFRPPLFSAALTLTLLGLLLLWPALLLARRAAPSWRCNSDSRD